MIFCEFNYCIYNKKYECILETISISAEDLCDECITPDIDEEIMEKAKKETLADLENRTITVKGIHQKIGNIKRN